MYDETTTPETSTEIYVHHLLRVLAVGGDHEAIVHQDQKITYSQAGEAILRAANALLSLGLRKGDAVGLFVGNRPESVILQLATHLIGCRLVFIPPELATNAMSAFVKRAAAKALIFDPGFDQRAEGLARRPGAPLALSLGPGAGQDLLELMATAPATLPDLSTAPDDVVTILFSGGTTGEPKLVTHSHSYYDVLIFAAAHHARSVAGPRRTLLCTLTTHTSGHVAAMMTLLAKGTIVLMNEFSAAEAVNLIQRERITDVILVPSMLYEILDHRDCPADGFPTVKRIFYGGAPTAPTRLRQAIERFGPVMRQSYGLTEVPVISVLEPDEHDVGRPERLRTCGKAFPGTEIDVRDAQGRSLDSGETGEIWVRSFLMTSGYWGDPEQSSKDIIDGWLGTGDIGYRDEDGYFYLVDRSKDVIITAPLADNVFSRLIDDFLVSLPGVRHAATVGAQHDERGEAIHVFIVPELGFSPIAADLRQRVLDELGPTYEPQGFTLVDALPWTPLGKIDKKALRARLAATA